MQFQYEKKKVVNKMCSIWSSIKYPSFLLYGKKWDVFFNENSDYIPWKKKLTIWCARVWWVVLFDALFLSILMGCQRLKLFDFHFCTGHLLFLIKQKMHFSKRFKCLKEIRHSELIKRIFYCYLRSKSQCNTKKINKQLKQTFPIHKKVQISRCQSTL